MSNWHLPHTLKEEATRVYWRRYVRSVSIQVRILRAKNHCFIISVIFVLSL